MKNMFLMQIIFLYIYIFPDKGILHNVKLKSSLNDFNQIWQNTLKLHTI